VQQGQLVQMEPMVVMVQLDQLVRMEPMELTELRDQLALRVFTLQGMGLQLVEIRFPPKEMSFHPGLFRERDLVLEVQPLGYVQLVLRKS